MSLLANYGSPEALADYRKTGSLPRDGGFALARRSIAYYPTPRRYHSMPRRRPQLVGGAFMDRWAAAIPMKSTMESNLNGNNSDNGIVMMPGGSSNAESEDVPPTTRRMKPPAVSFFCCKN